MPLTWYDVLIQLDEAPGGRLQMKVLAELVVLSRSGLTRLIDRIEKAGLVRRVASKDDRRGTFVELTSQGRKTTLRVRSGHHESLYRHFTRHLSEGDLRALDRAVRKVREGNLGNHDPGGRDL